MAVTTHQIMLLLLLQAGLLSAIASLSADSLLRVPLQRELVPIQRNGQVVSNKLSFSGSVSIGSPPQKFRTVMDTGSGHVIIPSERCQSKACLAHRRYNITASRTGSAVNADGSKVESLELADQLTIGFGTGQVLGEFAEEEVCLSSNSTSHEETSMECVGVRIITAVEMSEQPFTTFSFDGILGLGLSALSFSPEFSFFEAWSTQSTGKRQFAFFLTEQDEASPSELLIGGHDEAQTLEPLSWVPVTKPDMGYWQLEIKAVRVNGMELDFCRSGGCRGVFDTGTSHIGVPAPFDKELLRLLTFPEARLKSHDCRLAAAPDLEIEVPGLNLTLQPQHYMREKPLQKDIRLSESGGVLIQSEESERPQRSSSGLRGESAESKERFCRPRLMPVKLPEPLGPKLFLLGEPLLQRYYTVFDWDSQQIGLGLAANRRNINSMKAAEAKRQEEKQRQQAKPQQVDEIILLQLPRTSTVTKTTMVQEPEEEVCEEPF
mmetsp:Transcript_58292/g.103537  ORF Transcript_58292/g.103537 Transcript_58292/m.103537 type:complete len:491 (+) Transcript_58292:180-1652(+)